MRLQPAPTAVAMRSAPVRVTDTRLRGRWLLAARAAWLIVAAITLGLFIASIPAQVAFVQTVCATNACGVSQLDPSGVRALHASGISLGFYAAYVVALNVVFAAVFSLVGALLFWRRSDDRMALLASIALLTFGASAFTGALDPLALEHPGWRLPVATVNFLGSATFLLFLYVFPNARFEPRAMRWVALVVLVQQVLHYFFSFSPLDLRTWPVPLQLVVPIAILGTILFAQSYRYRRVSSTTQREQTKWVVLGIIFGLGGYLTVVTALNIVVTTASVPPVVVATLVGEAVQYACILLIPVSVAIALLRSRLFDVDLLINRALVYGALTVCVAGAYVLIVGSLGALFQTRATLFVSLVATGVVAVLFHPLHERLQRGVNRLIYGQRDEPYAAISRMSKRLEARLAPDAVLPAVVETVAQALKLPYAAIVLKDADELTIAASYGTPGGEPLRLPLIYQAETIGELRVSPRGAGDPWTLADRHLLGELARHAGAAAHAVLLTADLQRSNASLVVARERLVTAREEERRRLRRDLHDGLGPALAALTLKIGAARTLLPRDQAAADTLLAELSDDIQVTVGDIRRLAYDLRPPTLDELGLAGAIRERAAQYMTGNGAKHSNVLRVAVSAPDRLPALPAAVEVAAYRIMQEALTNVARHARAHTCQVWLTCDDMLQLEIADDGVGLPSERRIGVGLAAMRERAIELGGTCVVEPAPLEGPVCWLVSPSRRRYDGMPNEPLRVLIADDHPLFRDGMRALLTADLNTEVVGEATTGDEVIELAATLQPDVVLMDIQMPGISGIEATRRIVHVSPHIRILVVTMFEDDHSVFTAMRAGARGYVLKGARPEEMLRAIQAVGSGEAIFSPAIATRMLDFFSGLEPTALPHALPELTDREREILNLIAQGQSNAAIARQLVLSPKTISNYVSNIFSKLQVADRAQAMLRAREAGLG